MKRQFWIIAALALMAASVCAVDTPTPHPSNTPTPTPMCASRPCAGTITVAATSTTVLPGYAGRMYLALVNDSDEAIYVALGTAAVQGAGIRLNAAGGSLEIVNGNVADGGTPFTGTVYAICASGSKKLTVMEW